MNCESVRLWIQESLDGGGLPPEVRTHIADCPECSEFHERLNHVDRLLSEDPVLSWTPEMTANVVTRVRTERRERLVLGLAAAAVVVVAAWLAVGLIPAIPGGDAVVASLDLPASPTEAASRFVAGLGAFFTAALAALGSTPVSAGAPVAVAALVLLLLLNLVVAGRFRLVGRSS